MRACHYPARRAPARCVVALALVTSVSCKKSEPTTREERTEDALSRVASIEPKLAKVRKLDFKSSVSAAYQTGPDFRGHIHRVVEKNAKLVHAKMDALAALGLLPKANDLGHAIEDAYATQAAAYYDPEKKQFFLVMVPENKDTLDLVSAHELTHALQDQHFGLTAYLSGADNADAQTARQFVTEGDAMLSSIAYLVFDKTNLAELSREQVTKMREKMEEIANLDPPAMAAMLKQQASATSHMDPEIKKSLDAMDSIPPTILVPLLDSYMKGAVLALDAFERHGWQGVDELYRNPPESTEQVLHPNERLLKATDHPHRVTLPKLAKYELIDSDVIGELQWSVYFNLWKHEGDGHEEQNWGGDRYAVVRAKNGKRIALIATTWDGEYDAKLFFDAYVSTLETRYSAKPTPLEDQELMTDRALITHGDDTTWVLLDDKRVYIVDGGNDQSLIDTLIDGTTFE